MIVPNGPVVHHPGGNDPSPFPVDDRVLIPVPLDARFQDVAPRLPVDGYVVYLLEGGSAGPVYVGQTKHPRGRIRDHWRKTWWPRVTHIELHPVADELEARVLERAMASRLPGECSSISSFDRRRLRLLLAEAGC